MVRQGTAKYGQGVFADRPYSPGETILTFTGAEMTTAQADAQGVRHHCLDLGEGRQLLVDPPGRFVNHSCDPNAGLKDAVTLAAVRPIPAGEEIFFDYSTCVPDPDWSMNCGCGAVQCRGRIVAFPRLDETTKRRYLDWKVVPAWLRAIARP